MIEQARETIAKTTKRLTRSDVKPLSRRYKADIVFHTKRITGMWAKDTMDVRVKSLDENRYVLVFSNGTYFDEIYPIAKKSDAVQ